ncbi:hypothetical protein B0T11DRAFT_282324 [Plectosphaerella cucumerina]|uniref:Zn(2)-C6 fungal-type domain-containing protein n=1 Tax=Plectosphaerella cucumerina TaxID=40658 RepID=A0A8K0X409_9PEZI|nr:hypothetical protein B0T11DRAFT_282324 [Plectosphaerella cucumerina]
MEDPEQRSTDPSTAVALSPEQLPTPVALPDLPQEPDLDPAPIKKIRVTKTRHVPKMLRTQVIFTPESFPKAESGQSGLTIGRPTPKCWKHGCNGRRFSTFATLLQHQREMENSKFLHGPSKEHHVVEPTVTGFRHQLSEMYPHLAQYHMFLLDRLAQQLVVRCKNLIAARIRHLDLGNACWNGSDCANSSSTEPQAGKQGASGIPDENPMLDGFPAGIPMPPTTSMPAKFECPLCFTIKEIQTPKEWTKHVMKDVQPFICTFDQCREPRTFARKADWIRHENEHHRRLESWTCDIGYCGHTCYRQDNFLQHLIREHKYTEPESKHKPPTRGEIDKTWQKVIKCRRETDRTPQQEPCKFCGNMSTSWSELTAHLVNHMTELIAPVIETLESKPEEPPTEAALDNAMSAGTHRIQPLEYPELPAEPAWASNSAPRQQFLDQPSCPPLELDLIPMHLGSVVPFPISATEDLSTTKWRKTGACTLCTQRKVRCDEKMPCNNCSKLGLECRVWPTTSSKDDVRRYTGRTLDELLNGYIHPPITESGVTNEAETPPESPERGHGYVAAGQSQQPNTVLGTSHSAGKAILTTEDPKFERVFPRFTKDPIETTDASTQTMSGEEQHHQELETMREAIAEDDAEMSSPQLTERALSDADPVSTRPPTKMRQVGMAQITIKMLSLLGTPEGSGFGSDVEFQSESDGWDAEECWDDGSSGGGGKPGADGSGAITATHNSQTWAAAPGGTSASRGRPPSEDEDGERHRKRPKRQSGGLCSTSPQRRFACPFQAYEPARDCLKVSTRNPLGGCESIKRVK